MKKLELKKSFGMSSEVYETIGRNETPLKTYNFVLMTIFLAGVQFTWTVELAYGTPYLLSLGLSKQLTALVWLAGPIAGLIIQPLVGVYSDRMTWRIGRRRPFMIAGSVLVMVSVYLIAYSQEIALNVGIGPIPIAVGAFYLLDFAINAVQSSCRAMIVDVTPLQQQHVANAWAAAMIGTGNVLGYFTGYLDLVSLLPLLGSTQMKVLCVIDMIWFMTTLCITCISVNEQQYVSTADADAEWWHPIASLLRTIRCLPSPIQAVCNVQFLAWLGWFPFLFYSSSWIASKVDPVGFTSNDAATRAGSFALLLFALISVTTGLVMPLMASNGLAWSLPKLWSASLWFFCLLMLLTAIASDSPLATALIACAGVSWGIAQWVPFTLMGEFITHYSEFSETDADDIESSSSRLDLQLNAGVVLGIHNIYIVLPQFISTFISSIIFDIISKVNQGDTLHHIDSFGWALRVGGIASIFAGAAALKVHRLNKA